MTIRVGLIGDYSEGVTAHIAIPLALRLASSVVGVEVEPQWLPTVSLTKADSVAWNEFDAIWCVPGSPYANMAGVLETIKIVRTSKIPFLGTCGGFQHAVIEYFRNVLGVRDADHLESNPFATSPVISNLACSLVGAKGVIRFVPGSMIAAIYGKEETVESYHCRFGFNPLYLSRLIERELQITGEDSDGEPRVIELRGHPFFVATLFQPELSALEGNTHPLISAFLTAVQKNQSEVLRMGRSSS